MKPSALLLAPVLAIAASMPAAAQPVRQGHLVELPRPPHHRADRADTARLRFMREHPCPATGSVVADCPGWRVEYIVPPERGGADRPGNFKWERTDATRPAD